MSTFWHDDDDEAVDVRVTVTPHFCPRKKTN